MVGIDIVDISRIGDVVKKYGDKFLSRVFTQQELEYAGKKRRMYESLAGRFAAKEAFIKAYGKRVGWREIEIIQRGGKPSIQCRGRLYEDVSISHERAYAVAVVMIGKGE
ncbi:holo-ACP synthase [Syntrophorhabdus aromaticivorans]|uniref:Holo-[acyl-carrier-protein] synthase n=1 Tax=Syntrophorhabdus aromaticivorans TaxID=328301 RepID=A0A351U741_9BACT|nr:holo-ACP synthase [Syntrophorhabdus aromaticivorans]NLW35247.1 holo-ACP synthase [Syntrophorhabdus aromaticivorans]HBA55772.1 holo-[acyl-carrier-protein] synthase [Syntrophorhabdus aromaticivorans]